MTDSERLILAVDTARAAGDLLLKRHNLTITNKAAHDYVTDADRASEEFIRERLLGACPLDGFFGEEEGERGGVEGTWVVDPIDGTTNFIKNIPMYTVSIAYMRDGRLVVGAVYAPALGELFYARAGRGAFLNGAPIRVSDTANPRDAVAGTSFAHRDEAQMARMFRLLPRVIAGISDLRRLGSAAYDLCCVACGRYDAFFEPVLHMYDVAAGALIVSEAGGRVSGWPGEADYSVTGNILATNGKLQAWFEEALR